MARFAVSDRRARTAAALALTLPLALAPAALADDPWADNVESFDVGIGGVPDFADPNSALGEPSRFTGEVAFGGQFPGAVTPFQAAFDPDEVFSIGEGGSLVVSFDTPVTDDPQNPFGIDLLIFGNSFVSFLDGNVTNEGGVIEVSPDGIQWATITGVNADGLYPTLGYSDLTDPFATSPGSVLSDFTKPVDPAFNPNGLGFDDIVAGYDGSGGGAGIDLGPTGFGAISFVRITNPVGSLVSPEIDGLADVAVPAPGGVAIAALGLAFAGRRRR